MKNIVGIASIPTRENGLLTVLENLSPQVDKIYVWLNGYKNIPKTPYNNIEFITSEKNIGALAKLKILDHVKEKDFYYFTCDDDIIYPKNYIEYFRRNYISNTIISAHGKYFNDFPIKSYKGGDVKRLYFGGEVKKLEKTHIPGTGVCLMDSNIARKIPYNSFTTHNMLDVWVGCWAHTHDIKQYVIPHPPGWIKPNPTVSQTNSIWSQVSRNDTQQIKIINHYFTQ